MTNDLSPGSIVEKKIPASGEIPRRRTAMLTRIAIPGLVVMVLAVASGTIPGFGAADNIRAILLNASVVGILAVGMTPITLSGNFVSLAGQQQTVLAAIVFLSLLQGGVSITVAVLVVVVMSTVIGALQGIIVAAGLNPVVTTLAAGAVILGLMTMISGGQLVTAPGTDLSWLVSRGPFGVPTPVFLFIGFTICMVVVVDRTVIGRRLILVGSNRATAETSGLSARTAALWAFAGFGVAGAIAGVILSAQLGQITAGDASSLSIDVIAAVLVGGVAIKGGAGSPLNSAAGAVLIAVFTNIMLLLNFPEGWRITLVGSAVVVVVCVLHLLRKGVAR